MFRLVRSPAGHRVTQKFARNATTEAAQQKVSEVASRGQESAKQAGVKIQAAAKNAAAAGSKLVGSLTSRVGGILGNLSAVQKFQEPVVYYSKVVGEVAKQVYLKEKMSPPNWETMQSSYKSLWGTVSKTSTFKSLSPVDGTRIALYALEVYGFFVIGEMVGRRHLVGYNIPTDPISH